MNKQTTVWTTRDGRKIRICDMEDSHLLNTISFLEKKAEKVHTARLIDAYSGLSVVRGEMAEMCLENEINSMEIDGPDPTNYFLIYEKMLMEKERRNI